MSHKSSFFHHEADSTPMAVSSDCEHLHMPSRTLCDRWRTGSEIPAYISVRAQMPEMSLSITDRHGLVIAHDPKIGAQLVQVGSKPVEVCYPFVSTSPAVPVRQGLLSIAVAPVVGVSTHNTSDVSPVQLDNVLLDTGAFGVGTYMLYVGTRAILCLDVDKNHCVKSGMLQMAASPHNILYQRFANNLATPVALPCGSHIGAVLPSAEDAHALFLLPSDHPRRFIGVTLPVYRSNARTLLEAAENAITLADESNTKAANSMTAAEQSLKRWEEEETARTDEPTTAGEETAEAITASAAEERLTRHSSRADEDIAEAKTRLKTAQRVLRRWSKNAKLYRAARRKQRRLNRARRIRGVTLPKLDKTGFTAAMARFRATRKQYRTLKERRAKLAKAVERTTAARKKAARARKTKKKDGEKKEKKTKTDQDAEESEATKKETTRKASATASKERDDRGEESKRERDRIERDRQRIRQEREELQRELEKAREERRKQELEMTRIRERAIEEQRREEERREEERRQDQRREEQRRDEQRREDQRREEQRREEQQREEQQRTKLQEDERQRERLRREEELTRRPANVAPRGTETLNPREAAIRRRDLELDRTTRMRDLEERRLEDEENCVRERERLRRRVAELERRLADMTPESPSPSLPVSPPPTAPPTPPPPPDLRSARIGELFGSASVHHMDDNPAILDHVRRAREHQIPIVLSVK